MLLVHRQALENKGQGKCHATTQKNRKDPLGCVGPFRDFQVLEEYDDQGCQGASGGSRYLEDGADQYGGDHP